jgi:hypothetical protein
LKKKVPVAYASTPNFPTMQLRWVEVFDDLLPLFISYPFELSEEEIN